MPPRWSRCPPSNPRASPARPRLVTPVAAPVPQVKGFLDKNKTIEHIGLFGNDPKLDDDLPEIYKKLRINKKQRLTAEKAKSGKKKL